MPRDWQETEETKDAPTTQEEGPRLGPEGMRSMQGQNVGATDDAEPKLTLDDSQQVPLDELQGPFDPSKLEHRIGSPHADYQAYKGIEEAERQHELGRQASTIHLPGGAGAAEVAQALGNIISHEAGHLYGLGHVGLPPHHIMRGGETAPLRTIRDDWYWGPLSNEHLTKHLGLK